MCELKFLLKVINGIKDNKLISINLHVIIILFIETPKIEDLISTKINNLFLNQEIFKRKFSLSKSYEPFSLI